MKIRAGEKAVLEVKDYTFEFDGPIEITDDDLEELRYTVECQRVVERRIRKPKSGKMGFE